MKEPEWPDATVGCFTYSPIEMALSSLSKKMWVRISIHAGDERVFLVWGLGIGDPSHLTYVQTRCKMGA